MKKTIEVLKELNRERNRQVKIYGHTEEEDDKATLRQLRGLAIEYLLNDTDLIEAQPTFCAMLFPREYYRGLKDTYRRRLVTAAALIVAEIERVDRQPDLTFWTCRKHYEKLYMFTQEAMIPNACCATIQEAQVEMACTKCPYKKDKQNPCRGPISIPIGFVK